MNKKELVVVVFITFIVIMFWIISNILHDRSSVTLSPKLQQTLEDVNPNFDTATINKIMIITSGGKVSSSSAIP